MGRAAAAPKAPAGKGKATATKQSKAKAAPSTLTKARPAAKATGAASKAAPERPKVTSKAAARRQATQALQGAPPVSSSEPTSNSPKKTRSRAIFPRASTVASGNDNRSPTTSGGSPGTGLQPASEAPFSQQTEFAIDPALQAPTAAPNSPPDPPCQMDRNFPEKSREELQQDVDELRQQLSLLRGKSVVHVNK